MDEKIESRIDSIDEWINLLSKIQKSKEKTDLVKEAKENLIRKTVEAVIDIASRLIALEGLERPDAYSKYFKVLEKNEIIQEDLAESLAEMAQFRNMITHQYHKIDHEQLDMIIEEDIEDIRRFISMVIEYGEKNLLN